MGRNEKERGGERGGFWHAPFDKTLLLIARYMFRFCVTRRCADLMSVLGMIAAFLLAAVVVQAEFKEGTLRVLFLHGSGQEGPKNGQFVTEDNPWTKTYW